MSDTTQALAIAERIIRGDITQRTYTNETQVLRLASRYLFPDHGPINTVTTLAVGGTTITPGDDDGYEVLSHYVRRRYGYEWPAGSIITVTYKTGWATSGDYPTEVTEALAIIEAWLGTGPHSALTRTQVDDIVEVRDSGSRSPPPSARDLLQKWVRQDV